MSFNFRRRGWKNSSPFAGILIGFGLFFGSFVLLYLNEGRVDLSKIADDTEPISAEQVDGENQGELVAISGVLHSDEPLGDPELLTESNYLQLERSVEMYAWKETSDKDEDTGVETYEYRSSWESDPKNSQNFNNSNGHFNPPMSYRDEEFTVSSASVGAFSVEPNALLFMQKVALPLSEGLLVAGRVADEYIFIGEGTLNNPEVGDLRISYKVFLNDQSVTLFAKQDESQLRPYIHKDDTLLYRAYPSDWKTAVSSMRSEFLTLLFGFRAAGFVMMWIGLMTIASPLTTLLGRLPILGNAGKMVISVVAFIIAFILSLITIVVSAILHSPITLIAIFILLIVGGVYLWRKREEGGGKTAVMS